jgi:hypothetical protein
MGKHNARRRRRRAEYAVSATGASSREGYSASSTLEVSLPPARHSAPPRCGLRITVAFSSFACLRPTKDSWRGRYMANRRSITSKTLLKWVYTHCHLTAPVSGQIEVYSTCSCANERVIQFIQRLFLFPGLVCRVELESGHLENRKRALRRTDCAFYVSGL